MNFKLNDSIIELSIHSPTWAILFLLILIEIFWISKFKISFTGMILISVIIRIQLRKTLPPWWKVPVWSIVIFKAKNLLLAHLTCQNQLNKRTKTSTVLHINRFGKIKNHDTLLNEIRESDSKLTELIRDYKIRKVL
jgi:hypothetical protein